MIQGVPINQIQQGDYYRRFIVLKLLLEKMCIKQRQINEHQPYQTILQDLQNLEQSVTVKNASNHAKAYDTILRADQLNSKLIEMAAKVQQKKNNYEGELLKKWRNSLNVKKQNQEQSQKQKEEKSVSNKNLMYLSAELLKKERVSQQNLVNHRQKLNKIQTKITEMITQSSKQLIQKHQKLRQLIQKQRLKIGKIVEGYKQSIKREEKCFQIEIQLKSDALKNKIMNERKVSNENDETIRKLIKQLRNRNQNQ